MIASIVFYQSLNGKPHLNFTETNNIFWHVFVSSMLLSSFCKMSGLEPVLAGRLSFFLMLGVGRHYIWLSGLQKCTCATSALIHTP
jgi:hypothetical protein